MIRSGWLCLCWLAIAQGAEVYSYWIQPCTEDLAATSACRPADHDLVQWALEAWEQATGPGLRFTAASAEDDARVRIYWLGKKPQLYGDTLVVYSHGKRVRIIEVQPDLSQFGARIAKAGESDPLFRDTVIYLTCLHEIGHMLSVPHTDDFTDIMYDFQYGGDVLEFFNRYRRTLHERLDIQEHSGISEADRKRVAAIYAER